MDKIAIQGVKASFHDEAARKYFKKDFRLVSCSTFKHLCTTVETKEADYGVMAIENTFSGSILPNYSLIRKFGLKIRGEEYLRISQHLLCLNDQKLEDIKVVRSHPIALLQCSEFLEANPSMKPVEEFDTAGCAREIAERKEKGVAAIAGDLAAKEYGLKVLVHEIENIKQNHTRFLIIGRDSLHSPEVNKASICFTLPHKPGSLSRVLNIFEFHQINIVKIQSVPIIGKPYQYDFHLDLEWDAIKDWNNTWDDLKGIVENPEILGLYKKGKVPL